MSDKNNSWSGNSSEGLSPESSSYDTMAIENIRNDRNDVVDDDDDFFESLRKHQSTKDEHQGEKEQQQTRIVVDTTPTIMLLDTEHDQNYNVPELIENISPTSIDASISTTTSAEEHRSKYTKIKVIGAATANVQKFQKRGYHKNIFLFGLAITLLLLTLNIVDLRTVYWLSYDFQDSNPTGIINNISSESNIDRFQDRNTGVHVHVREHDQKSIDNPPDNRVETLYNIFEVRDSIIQRNQEEHRGQQRTEIEQPQNQPKQAETGKETDSKRQIRSKETKEVHTPATHNKATLHISEEDKSRPDLKHEIATTEEIVMPSEEDLYPTFETIDSGNLQISFLRFTLVSQSIRQKCQLVVLSTVEQVASVGKGAALYSLHGIKHVAQHVKHITKDMASALGRIQAKRHAVHAARGQNSLKHLMHEVEDFAQRANHVTKNLASTSSRIQAKSHLMAGGGQESIKNVRTAIWRRASRIMSRKLNVSVVHARN
uniref:Uncharacterized protein n=1 Tax=Pseudo-nitzschia australis TaxID=44445 RepID=A0A7S4EH70_9STRA